jgi:hypothetical protein
MSDAVDVPVADALAVVLVRLPSAARPMGVTSP